MKQHIKRLLYSVAPQWTTAIMSARSRAHSHRIVASGGGGSLNQKLIERFGSRVKEGPFAGLALTPMTHAEQIGPYLLGVYESELDEAWSIVFQRSYTQIVDIGAKFGYYAIGLARKYPEAAVVAFDTDWWARQAVREMADANETRNVEILGYCSPGWVAQHLQDGALIVSDCEGYEAALFGPTTMPRLRSATLVIETHDCFVPGVTEKLRAAFDETHTVRAFGHEARRETSCDLDFLSERERELATHEVRPAATWLLCSPRTGPEGTRVQSGREPDADGP